ncbi:MAG: molybdopterin-dependent oxidoreductase [Eubacteriales bacterium]|nr:molybdopterin-dependent oxidoreductase [Eubacteriales bacterium]
MGAERIRGICGICPDKCDVVATVEDGKLVRVEPDWESKRGRLCPRGALAPQIMNSEKRLLHPLIRTGERGSGEFREADFEEALEYAADLIRRTAEKYGPDSLVSYVGTSGREPSTMVCFGGKHGFFRQMGGINDTNCGSTCNFASYVVAPVTTFGIPQYNIRPDLENTELIFIWGKNPATDSGCQALYKGIRAARERGARVVAIDPRSECNNGEYDEWVPVIPGTDGALILGMAKLVIESGRYDHAFVDKHVSGFEEWKEYLAGLTLSGLSGICGVPEEKIRALTEEFLAKKAVIIAYTGLEYQYSAIQTNRASWILWAICGKMDTPGGMLFAGKGYSEYPLHPVPEGRKPIGTARFPLFYRLSGNAQIGEEFLTGILEDKPYPIRGYLLCAGGTSLSFPEQSRWEEAYRKLDAFIVLERFMSNDARFADVIFPATTYFENEAVVMQPDGMQLRRRIVSPPGEAKCDTFILQALAEKLGFGDAYPKNDEEMLLWQTGGNAALAKALKEKPEGVIRAVEQQYEKYEDGSLRADGKPGFPTPSGKIEIASSLIEDCGLPGLPVYHDIHELEEFGSKEDFPMMLTTGARSKIRFATFGPNIPEIAKAEPDPLMSIDEEDARRLGIADGDTAFVETAFGNGYFKAHVCRMAKGSIHIPFGGGSPYMSGGWKEGNVNRLTSMKHSDPVSGFICYKSLPCRVRKA